MIILFWTNNSVPPTPSAYPKLIYLIEGDRFAIHISKNIYLELN